MDENVVKADAAIMASCRGMEPDATTYRHYPTIRARLVELESLLAGIDAEQVVTASEKHGDALGALKDARRWRHARTILPVEYIEDSQREFESSGLPVSEEESIAADEAIDAAMHNSAREVGE